MALVAASASMVACGGESTTAGQGETKNHVGEKPNVIVVLVDDLGSGDVGFNGCVDIPTPNIDRIAAEGANCTNAYISAPYSGPSRAGLLTGRYQQRCGVDGNTEDFVKSVEERRGVLPEEVLMSETLKEQGYATCAIGKWHLGDNEELWPQNQGFDYFYGFSGGGHDYWGRNSANGINFIQENGRKIEPTDQTYITDDFSDKAVDFINDNSDNPFFIYLAYNAPHAGLSAPKRYLDRTTHIHNAERSVYGAMIVAVDDGVGRVWEALEKNGIEDNTIVIFLSDNGGAQYEYAINYPRRARKGTMYDGGTKTPFAIYWKDHIEAGMKYDKTVSSLDIFATAVTAAGYDVTKAKNKLDGVDLIPYLNGSNSETPNPLLFWRVVGGEEWAVRKDDYKLVKRYNDEPELYNLANDPYEVYNIAAENPTIVADLNKEYAGWSAELPEPRWADKHMPNQVKDYENWIDFRQKHSGNR